MKRNDSKRILCAVVTACMLANSTPISVMTLQAHSENISNAAEKIAAQSALLPLENYDFNDFSNWISGDVSFKTGEEGINPDRLYSKEYIEVKPGTEYILTLNNKTNEGKDTYYKVVVREYDENGNYLTVSDSIRVTNGNAYVSSADARKVKVVLYQDQG